MIQKLIKTFSLLKNIFLRRKTESHSSSIALVKLDAIGDFFIFLSALKMLEKEELERSEITVFCSDILIDLGNSFYPNIKWIGVNLSKFEKNSNYRELLIKDHQEDSFSKIINLVYSRDWKSDYLISSLSSVTKTAYLGDHAKQGQFGRWLGSKIYDVLYFEKCITEFESLVSILGKEFTISPTTTEASEIERGNYVVIFPGASWFGKAWPVENFRKVIENIIEESNYDIKICGGPGDEHLIESFESISSSRISILIGQTSLMELSNLIRKAKLILTNDTSAAHIAQFFGTKGIALIGGGHFGRFLPYSEKDEVDSIKVLNKKMDCYGCNWNCHFSHGNGAVPCLSEIGCDEVYSELKVLL